MHDRTDDILGGYEWDPLKARRNRLKHGVAFIDAVAALEDERGLTLVDADDSEARNLTVGMDYEARCLAVIWTRRGARYRIISARKATASERAAYRWER